MTLSPARRVALRFAQTEVSWGVRLAGVLTRIASTIGEMLGRVVYAEFLARGVLGLTENPKVSGARDVQHLTVGERAAARLFGTRAYRLLLLKLGDPGLAEDAIQQFLKRLLERGLPLQPDTPLGQAEAYVLKGLLHAGLDLLRKQRPLAHRDWAEPFSPDLEDAAALARLEHLLPESQLHALLQALDRVNPRARQYVELLVEGYRPAEIAREWRVSQPYFAKWLRRYGPEIQHAVRRRIEARLRRVSNGHTTAAVPAAATFPGAPRHSLGLRVPLPFL
jgi:DNA-directed RNA polymerase specialized sigma24 family protein